MSNLLTDEGRALLELRIYRHHQLVSEVLEREERILLEGPQRLDELNKAKSVEQTKEEATQILEDMKNLEQSVTKLYKSIPGAAAGDKFTPIVRDGIVKFIVDEMMNSKKEIEKIAKGGQGWFKRNLPSLFGGKNDPMQRMNFLMLSASNFMTSFDELIRGLGKNLNDAGVKPSGGRTIQELVEELGEKPDKFLTEPTKKFIDSMKSSGKKKWLTLDAQNSYGDFVNPKIKAKDFADALLSMSMTAFTEMGKSYTDAYKSESSKVEKQAQQADKQGEESASIVDQVKDLFGLGGGGSNKEAEKQAQQIFQTEDPGEASKALQSAGQAIDKELGDAVTKIPPEILKALATAADADELKKVQDQLAQALEKIGAQEEQVKQLQQSLEKAQETAGDQEEPAEGDIPGFDTLWKALSTANPDDKISDKAAQDIVAQAQGQAFKLAASHKRTGRSLNERAIHRSTLSSLLLEDDVAWDDYLPSINQLIGKVDPEVGKLEGEEAVPQINLANAINDIPELGDITGNIPTPAEGEEPEEGELPDDIMEPVEDLIPLLDPASEQEQDQAVKEMQKALDKMGVESAKQKELIDQLRQDQIDRDLVISWFEEELQVTKENRTAIGEELVRVNAEFQKLAGDAAAEKAELETQMQSLKDELEDKKGQLEAAPEEVKEQLMQIAGVKTFEELEEFVDSMLAEPNLAEMEQAFAEERKEKDQEIADQATEIEKLVGELEKLKEAKASAGLIKGEIKILQKFFDVFKQIGTDDSGQNKLPSGMNLKNAFKAKAVIKNPDAKELANRLNQAATEVGATRQIFKLTGQTDEASWHEGDLLVERWAKLAGIK